MANGNQNIGDQCVLVILCMVTKNEFDCHKIGNNFLNYHMIHTKLNVDESANENDTLNENP
jgi:hypothetical protein